jgi:hypothetical protein
MAMAKAVPEMSSGRIFKEWKSIRPAKLSYAPVIETKNAQPAIGSFTGENDTMRPDTGRANLRLGPNIPSEAAELLLDTSMSDCRSNHTSERRFAAEKCVMPEDEPSNCFRIALSRATPP